MWVRLSAKIFSEISAAHMSRFFYDYTTRLDAALVTFAKQL